MEKGSPQLHTSVIMNFYNNAQLPTSLCPRSSFGFFLFAVKITSNSATFLCFFRLEQS